MVGWHLRVTYATPWAAMAHISPATSPHRPKSQGPKPNGSGPCSPERRERPSGRGVVKQPAYAPSAHSQMWVPSAACGLLRRV